MKRFFKTESYLQLIIVFLVFAISGSLSVVVSKPVLNFVGLDKIDSAIIKTLIRILIIFPLYQVILIFIGTIFGQFQYFWNFEKRFWKKFSLRTKNH